MNVLILGCNTGPYSTRVSRAINEAFLERGIGAAYADLLRIVNERISGIVTASCNTIRKYAPDLFRLAQQAGDALDGSGLISAVHWISSVCVKRIHEFLCQNEIDFVICTHVFAAEVMANVRKAYHNAAKYYSVITDYQCAPSLQGSCMDGYFVPHQSSAETCAAQGMPRTKLLNTGLPVAGRFLNPMQKAQARNYLVIPHDALVYLVMDFGGNDGAVLSLLRKFVKAKQDRMILHLVTERNSALGKSVRALYRHDRRIQVVTYTEHIDAYMSAADVIVTRPDGVTSTQAAVVRLPIVHMKAASKGESLNAEWFANMGMSRYAGNIDAVVRSALRMAKDTDESEKMRQAQARCLHPFGARNAAEFIIGAGQNSQA